MTASQAKGREPLSSDRDYIGLSYVTSSKKRIELIFGQLNVNGQTADPAGGIR